MPSDTASIPTSEICVWRLRELFNDGQYVERAATSLRVPNVGHAAGDRTIDPRSGPQAPQLNRPRHSQADPLPPGYCSGSREWTQSVILRWTDLDV